MLVNSQLDIGDRITDSSHKVIVLETRAWKMNLADVGGDKRTFDRSEIAIVFDRVVNTRQTQDDYR